MEKPSDPTTVAFWDMGSRSDTMASKPTGVMARSQAEIRSITRQIPNRRLQVMKLPRQPRLPLYTLCELVTSQVRAMQKPQHRRKMVNNTVVALRVRFVPVPLSIQGCI